MGTSEIMEKIILSVPAFHWMLCLIGFAVHLLMKWGNAITKKKSFITKSMGISIAASLFMSAGMVMAFSSYFADNPLLPFASLGAGYLNNSIWTNIMNVVGNKVKNQD